MADISAIKALDGVTYSIKDSEARDHLVPASGTTGQVLTKTASGYGWADASGGGTVDTVNGISPDSNKNVQVDVELTQAQYDALPASKLTDDVNYFIKDGAYRPQGGVIDAEGVMYDNTESGLTSDTVQGAIDENASAIEELSAGLMDFSNEEICGYLGTTPVYRTVITNLSVSNNGQIANLSSLGIVKMVRLYGSGYDGSQWFGLPYYDSSSHKCTLYYYATKKNLGAWTDRTYTNCTIFIEYTKE